MFDIVKRLFSNKSASEPDEQYKADFAEKKAGLERLLGPMCDVADPPVPYFTDMDIPLYHFTQCLVGTALVTMDLIKPFTRGPKSRRAILHELVAFTKHTIPDADSSEPTPYDQIEQRIGNLFSTIARYSTVAALKPGDCCEVPQGNGSDRACIVFSEYTSHGEGFHIATERYCLLLCLEVHRPELEYARAHGNAALIEKLKAAGHYPYSDLDRASVV